MNNTETDAQTATRLGVSLEDYHRVIAPVESNAGEFEGHTKGPWFYYFDDSPCTPVAGWKVKRDSDIQEPIALLPVMTPKGKLTQEANAKLIAAAPTLLAERDRLRERVAKLEETLSNIVEVWKHDDETYWPLHQAIGEAQTALAEKDAQ